MHKVGTGTFYLTHNFDFAETLVAAAKVPAESKDALVSFMEGLEDKETVEFGENQETPLSFFKDFLSKLPAQVEFGQKGDKAVETKETTATEFAEEIQAFIKEKAEQGITVSTAQAATELKQKGEK